MWGNHPVSQESKEENWNSDRSGKDRKRSGTHTEVIQVDTFGVSLRAISGVDDQCTSLEVAVIAETYRERQRGR